MSESIRLYKYQALLANGRGASRERLMAAVEVSLATFKRDIAKLRDQMNVPVEFDRDSGCCKFNTIGASAEIF
jgi:predicted DNA-binding transcriptional regulator YafY